MNRHSKFHKYMVRVHNQSIDQGLVVYKRHGEGRHDFQWIIVTDAIMGVVKGATKNKVILGFRLDFKPENGEGYTVEETEEMVALMTSDRKELLEMLLQGVAGTVEQGKLIGREVNEDEVQAQLDDFKKDMAEQGYKTVKIV